MRQRNSARTWHISIFLALLTFSVGVNFKVDAVQGAKATLPRVIGVSPNPIAMALDKATHRLAVLSWGSKLRPSAGHYPLAPHGPGTVTLVNTTTDQVISRLETPSPPRFILNDSIRHQFLIIGGEYDTKSSGSWSYPFHDYPGFALLLDAAAGKVRNFIMMPRQGRYGVLSSRLGQAFLVASDSTSVLLINLSTGKLDGSIPINYEDQYILPMHFTVDNHTGQVYLGTGSHLYAFEVKRRGEEHLWNLTPFRQIGYAGYQVEVEALSVDQSNGHLYVSVRDPAYVLWAFDARHSGSPLWTAPFSAISDPEEREGYRSELLNLPWSHTIVGVGTSNTGYTCTVSLLELAPASVEATSEIQFCGEENTTWLADVPRHQAFLYSTDFSAMGPEDGPPDSMKRNYPGFVYTFIPKYQEMGRVVSLNVPGGVGGVAVDEALGKVYIANRALSSISVIDANTLKLPTLPQPPTYTGPY